MFVIAGATGQVGGATAKKLLYAGAEVRVLVRHRDAMEAWTKRGADARIAPLEKHEELRQAIRNCAGMFVLLPFNLEADDPEANAQEIIDSVARAVYEEKVPHVVMLSSGGADLEKGTGPIVGLHLMEEALCRTGVKLTALRPGHFQEKVTELIDVARNSGVYPVFAGSADEPIPMVATSDIGDVAAQSLLTRPISSETVDLIGPAYTERYVAEVLGRSLDQDLHVTEIPEHAWVDTLLASGLNTAAATSLAQLYAADDRGLLAPRGNRSVHVYTSIETTISNIVADWKQQRVTR